MCVCVPVCTNMMFVSMFVRRKPERTLKTPTSYIHTRTETHSDSIYSLLTVCQAQCQVLFIYLLMCLQIHMAFNSLSMCYFKHPLWRTGFSLFIWFGLCSVGTASICAGEGWTRLIVSHVYMNICIALTTSLLSVLDASSFTFNTGSTRHRRLQSRLVLPVSFQGPSQHLEGSQAGMLPRVVSSSQQDLPWEAPNSELPPGSWLPARALTSHHLSILLNPMFIQLEISGIDSDGYFWAAEVYR